MYHNPKFSPNNATNIFDHRPIRWVVRQIWNTEGYQEEVLTGYHNKLDSINGMTSSLHQALFNLQKYGGELYADYSDGKPVLVRKYS